MRQLLLLFTWVFGLTVSAQEMEVVDSIDVETGVIYYADSTQVSDTINTDTIDCANPPIPQIPLDVNFRYIRKQGSKY